jgi:hypothetical protein
MISQAHPNATKVKKRHTTLLPHLHPSLEFRPMKQWIEAEQWQK